MYNMSSLLHTKYELLTILQNTSYILFTIYSLTEAPAPQKLIYQSSAYQLQQYLALGPTTMSSAMLNLHQRWHKKRAQCVCIAAQIRCPKASGLRRLVRLLHTLNYLFLIQKQNSWIFLFRNKRTNNHYYPNRYANTPSVHSPMYYNISPYSRLATSFQFDSHQ